MELSKQGIIKQIAFLKKGQYEVYKKLGYSCSYLKENFILKEENKKTNKEKNQKIDIGIYPLNYTWDKNIFNQLCIPKFIENSNLNYNILDERMQDFVETMDIDSTIDNIEEITEENIINKVVKNDINISCSFTEYFHTIFFLSMEQGVPCIIGNTSDFFEEDEPLKQYIVTSAEDNSIINSKLVMKCIENKEKVMQLYKKWKQQYNEKANKSIEDFLEN